MWRDIATQIAEKCVDPGTKRPYTVGMVEKAMQEIHYSVKPGKNAKAQAVEVIRLLQEKKTMPIERAKMRVRITMPNKDGKKMKEKFTALVDDVEDEDWNQELVEISSLLTDSCNRVDSTSTEKTLQQIEIQAAELKQNEANL